MRIRPKNGSRSQGCMMENCYEYTSSHRKRICLRQSHYETSSPSFGIEHEDIGVGYTGPEKSTSVGTRLHSEAARSRLSFIRRSNLQKAMTHEEILIKAIEKASIGEGIDIH